MHTDLTSLQEDLHYERRRMEQADNALIEGRLADESVWRAAQRRRREFIVELEAREAVLLAELEVESVLADGFDAEFDGRAA